MPVQDLRVGSWSVSATAGTAPAVTMTWLNADGSAYSLVGKVVKLWLGGTVFPNPTVFTGATEYTATVATNVATFSSIPIPASAAVALRVTLDGSLVAIGRLMPSTLGSPSADLTLDVTVTPLSFTVTFIGGGGGGASSASGVSFTPDGSIAATNVQAAIVEVRDEAAGGGAPSTADFLVGTAQGGLSAEIVVGATPGGELGGTWASPTVDASHSGSTHASIQSTAQAALDAHTGDTSAAHAASAISADSATLVGTGTDVQAVLEELDNGIADHLADSSAAHAASAVSVSSTTLVGTGSDAQAVFEELDNAIVADETALANHLADTSDAHDASAISILDTAADFTATAVEGALAELQADAEADVTALSDHVADTSAAHAASAVSVSSATLVGTGTDVQAVFEELNNAIVADETALANHLADTSDAHDASAISVSSTTLVGTGTDVQAVFEEMDDAIVARVGLNGAETVAGVKTFSSDPLIPDEAYDATAWNGVLEPPTKNAVRDKVETLAPIASPTFTGVATTPVLVASGITGAVAATRYVGGTASSYPSSGTFAIGDFVIDQTGQVWVCTVAGSPGTWAAPGSGRELGYTEITAGQTTTAIGSANRVDVTGLTTTVTVASRPVVVEASFGACSNDTADKGVGIALIEGTTFLAQSIGTSPAINAQFPCKAKIRLAPSAGSHTYKVMFWATLAGSGSVLAGASTPAFIMVTEV